MNSLKALQQNPQLYNLISSYWQWRKIWILTTVGFCGLGLIYAVLLKRDSWVASQGLIVRDEATGAIMRLGRFQSQTEMKTAQETVLEMARNPQVIYSALKTVGRPARFFGLFQSNAEPTKAEVEAFGKTCVSVRAPRGAELGTTEVIYLDVKQNSKAQAIKLASALCDSLESQLKMVRIERANGVIAELEAAQKVSSDSLTAATQELQRLEVEAGSDLADLRSLSDSNIGSTNRLMLDMVRDEIRRADLSMRNVKPNMELAKAALQNSGLLLQAAEACTEIQPALGKLRDGLAKAMVDTSTVQGIYTDSHPEVLRAQHTENALRNKLKSELSSLIASCEITIAITQQKIESLNQQEAELGKRLNRLADMHGKHSNQTAEVKARRDNLSQLNNELIQTIAARDAAQAASLLTRLDSPVIGEKPVGPGRTTIIGGATVGGLLLGLGVVFLLVPLDVPTSTSTVSNATRKTASGAIDDNKNSGTEATVASDKQALKKENKSELKDVEPFKPVGKKVETALAAMVETVQKPIQRSVELGSSTQSPIATDTSTKVANSATAAAKALEKSSPKKPESLDDVRAMIANALKSHSQSDNS